MVELRTRRREMRGDRANHQETLGHKRRSCESQFTIPDTAGTSPDPVSNDTIMKSSQPNRASHTPDFSYSLVSSTLFSSAPSLSFLSTPIIAEHKVESFLSITPCHKHQLTPSTSIHQVQHTPSTVYPRLFDFPPFP